METTTTPATASKKYQGAKVSKATRLAIYIRDGFTCMCCGSDLRNANPNDITLDHLKCNCKGGTLEASNLVTCCRKCNCSRRATVWTKFYPAGAHARVRAHVRRKLNLKLAKALIAGHIPPAEKV